MASNERIIEVSETERIRIERVGDGYKMFEYLRVDGEWYCHRWAWLPSAVAVARAIRDLAEQQQGKDGQK